MDYRLNRIDSEEKNRILSLHESATKKEYLVTGKKPLFEQEEPVDEQTTLGKAIGDITSGAILGETTDNARSIARQIYKASSGMGTDESAFLSAVRDIKSDKEFFMVDKELKRTDYGGGFSYFVSDEFGTGDEDYLIAIQRHLKSIGIETEYRKMADIVRFTVVTKLSDVLKKYMDTGDKDSGIGKERDLNWGDRYACVANYEGAEKVQLKDKSHAYKINGVVFYNNGRKMENGQMSNYSCKDKMFAGQTKTEDPKPTETKNRGGSLSDTTVTIQKQIGVNPDGKFGQESINAAYAAITK